MDGTVTTAAYDSYYGNYVVIEDSNGYCTKYAHMDTLSVSAGQTVKAWGQHRDNREYREQHRKPSAYRMSV